MQTGFYILVIFLAGLGVLMVRGQKGAIKQFGRNMTFAVADLKNKIKYYSRKLKLREWLKKHKEEKIDKEIYESISFLRNLIALGNGRRAGSDYIIEQLSRREGTLQTVYVRMLRFLRLGKLEEAIKAFSTEAVTPIGNEFGSLLLKWDSLDPVELTEILISYQKNIKEVKSTSQRKQDEMVSELIYFPVVLNIFIIFINFIVVGYFMEQRHMLSMLF